MAVRQQRPSAEAKHGPPPEGGAPSSRTDSPAASSQNTPATESWASVMNALAEPVWVMDAECRIQYCNRAAQKLFGTEIIGRHCWEVAHGSRETVPECPFPRMCQSGCRESADVLISGRWFNCTVDPLFDAEGKVSGALHVLWDVTSRRQTQESLRAGKELLERRVAERTAELSRANQTLRQNEKQLRLLIENAPVAMAMFDREMRYLAVSRRWLEDYRLAGRDLIGRTHYEIFPELSEPVKAFHRRALAGETLHEDEGRFERADGSVLWLCWDLRPWFDATGGIGGVVLLTEDITARKTAELALHDAGEFNRQVINDANEGIIVYGSDLRYQVWNRCMEELTGLPAAEVIGRHPLEVFPFLREMGVIESLQMALAGKVMPSRDFPYLIAKTGRNGWVTDSSSPLRNASGEIVGVIGIVRDITERKQAEAALRESHERLTKVIQNEAVGVMFWDAASGVMVDSNDTCLKLLGYSQRELAAGKLTWQKLTPPEFHEASREELKKFAATGRVGPYEKEYFLKDGTRQWFLFAGSALGNGIIVEFCVDISAKKQAEAALRETQEQIQYFFDNARDILFEIDLEGNYTFGNAAAERVTGYPPGELLRMNMRQMVLPEHHHLLAERLRQRAAGEVDDKAFEIEIRHKDGHRIWVELATSAVLDQEGRLEAIQGVARDISERKRMEENLAHERARFKLIFDTVPIGIAFHTTHPDGTATRNINDAHLRICGLTRGQHDTPEIYRRITHPDDRAVQDRFQNQVKAGKISGYTMEKRYLHSDGKTVWVSFSYQREVYADGTTEELTTVVDITARKQAEQLLHRTNRTLQAIRDCHEAMLRAGTEPELLNHVCRIIVQTGGERMAWVGFAQNDARKTVRPVARAGVARDYLARVNVTWADRPRGRGPVGTAIRTGKPCFITNTQTDSRFVLWRADAHRHGYGSVIALPLLVNHHCFGALAIYAAAPDAFDAAEQVMLTDLANDLAFGISTLRLRAERERLENEMLSSIEREQERIGRDLHDGLCQILVGAKFRSGYLEKIAAPHLPEAAREARKLEKMLNQAIEQARDMARGLNPVKLTSSGLPSALRAFAEDAGRMARVNCFCRIPERLKMADHHAANHLYRIAQEAVQNALKHARAQNISITLAREGRNLVLSVKDDGAGIPRTIKKAGMGLSNMQMRASLIGGRLEIRRRKSGGTEVACTLFPGKGGVYESSQSKHGQGG